MLIEAFGSGYSVTTVQRIGSGTKIPPREVLDFMLDLADEHAGPLDDAARTTVTDAYDPALKHSNPTLHEVYELRDQLARCRADAEHLADQNTRLQADLAVERLRFLKWTYDHQTRSWSVIGTWWPGPTTACLTLETHAQPGTATEQAEAEPPRWFVSFDPPDAAANGSIVLDTISRPRVILPSQRVPWSHRPVPPGDDPADPPRDLTQTADGDEKTHYELQVPAEIFDSSGGPEPSEPADVPEDPGNERAQPATQPDPAPAEELTDPLDNAQPNGPVDEEQEPQRPAAHAPTPPEEHHDTTPPPTGTEHPAKEDQDSSAADAADTRSVHQPPPRPRQPPVTGNTDPDVPRSADQLIALVRKLTSNGHNDHAYQTVLRYADIYTPTDTGRLAHHLHRSGFSDLARQMAISYATRTPQEVADLAATLRNSQMDRVVPPLIEAFANTRLIPDIAQLAHRLHGPSSDWYAEILLSNLGPRTLADHADLVESLPPTRALTRTLLGDRAPAVRAELLSRGNTRAADALAPPPPSEPTDSDTPKPSWTPSQELPQ
ncbi:hypothetical protein ACWCXH_38915 [Kitasatospora sp. NPDC001660]